MDRFRPNIVVSLWLYIVHIYPEVAVAPPLSVVKCLWEVFVWGSCRARVCAGVGGVFSVGVSCVRVTC